MTKETKKIMRVLSHQMENISKEVKCIKQSQNQIEILELKSTVNEIKNSLLGLKFRYKQTEERISNLENRSLEIILF